MSDISVIAEAVGKVVDAITKWLGSADVRRRAKAIRLGDKIVLRIKDLGVEDKKLSKYVELWDKYNN